MFPEEEKYKCLRIPPVEANDEYFRRSENRPKIQKRDRYVVLLKDLQFQERILYEG